MSTSGARLSTKIPKWTWQWLRARCLLGGTPRPRLLFLGRQKAARLPVNPKICCMQRDCCKQSPFSNRTLTTSNSGRTAGFICMHIWPNPLCICEKKYCFFLFACHHSPVMNADLYFHGTSESCGRAILRQGFKPQPEEERTWYASEEGMIYFLSLRQHVKSNFGGDASPKDYFRDAITTAFRQASCSCAARNEGRRFVFVVNLAGIEKEEDSSCNYPSAVQVPRKVPRGRIVAAFKDSYDWTFALPFWRADFLNTNRRYAARPIKTASGFERAVGRVFLNNPLVDGIDDLYEEEFFEQISLPWKA
jgi:hypothetical protein